MSAVAHASHARMVNVCASDYEPLAYRLDDGSYAGLAVEVLEEVARQGGWTLNYEEGSAAECMDRLMRGEADLQAAIAYSPELEGTLEFTRETLVVDWGEVYVRKDEAVHTVFDLEGSRVAFWRGSVHAETFFELARGFGVSVRPVAAGDRMAAFGLVEQGEADALVVSRLFAHRHARDFRVHTTTIAFSPIDIRMAARGGRGREMIAEIDVRLVEMKGAQGSVYYAALERALGGKPSLPKTTPKWVEAALMAVIGLVLTFVALSLELRRRVAARTRELAESAENYRTLFENIPERIFTKDARSVYASCNRNFAADLGVEPRKVVGRTDYDFFPPELAARYQADDAAVIGTGETLAAEEKYVVGGRELYIHIIRTPLRDNAGGVLGVLGIFHDVTERKRVEEALYQSKRDWEETFDIITDMITVHDKNFNIIRANKAAAEILGLSWLEMPRAKCFEKYHGTDRPPEGCPSCECLKSGEPSTNLIFEPHIGKHLEITALPRKNESGEIVGLIHIVRDMSERIAAEQMLARRQEALQSVYRMATSAPPSLQGICEEAALSLSRILGVQVVWVAYSREDGGTGVACAVEGRLEQPPEMPDASLARPLSKGCMPVAQGFARERGGCAFEPRSEALVPVLDGEGAELGCICLLDSRERTFSGDDILPAEIFARYIAKEIENRRTAQELRRAQKMEVIGSLAGGVAHEVRNPLNAIMAISDALRSDLGGNPEYEQLLFHMRLQVDRLAALMSDLLELGKPAERERFMPEFLGLLCAAAIDVWRGSAHELTHEVRLDLAPGAERIRIMADAKRIQQVIVNLLDNAAQHSPEGSGIRVVIPPPEGGSMQVLVVDRGSGVPDDVLPRVFDAFFSTRRKGTGLGLSIVKHIVEAHGGSVSMRSNAPEPGVTLEVRLPALMRTEDGNEA